MFSLITISNTYCGSDLSQEKEVMPFVLWLQIWHHMKAKVHMDMYDIAIGYLHLCVKGDSTDVKEVLTLI